MNNIVRNTLFLIITLCTNIYTADNSVIYENIHFSFKKIDWKSEKSLLTCSIAIEQEVWKIIIPSFHQPENGKIYSACFSRSTKAIIKEMYTQQNFRTMAINMNNEILIVDYVVNLSDDGQLEKKLTPLAGIMHR